MASLVHLFTLLALLVLRVSAFFANSTPGLVMDARMRKDCTTPYTFDDTATSPFLVDSALGLNLTWDKVITLPELPNSLFDPQNLEAPIEIEITDASIFTPNQYPKQSTYRRADLSANLSYTPYLAQLWSTPPGYPSVSGIKTLHFSLQNTNRTLNYTHDYKLSWMENQTFTHKDWQLKTGTLTNGTTTTNNTDPKHFQLIAYDLKTTLWKAPFTDGWHNFGVVMDFVANTIQLFYSTGTEPLAKATGVINNFMGGGGQYHFGVHKLPIGANTSASNVYGGAATGYQESNINESIVYAGIFMEDGASGQISLDPWTKGKIG